MSGTDLAKTETIRVGVVLERRRIGHPWQEFAWRPVSVFVGAPPVEAPRLLLEGDGWAQFHAATLAIDLFRSDTAGYQVNLSQTPPKVWVVLRPVEGGEPGAIEPFHVTACPVDAEGYLISGTETVEAVPMPDAVLALVRDYVAAYHVEVPFEKRQRKPYDPRKGGGHGRG